MKKKLIIILLSLGLMGCYREEAIFLKDGYYQYAEIYRWNNGLCEASFDNLEKRKFPVGKDGIITIDGIKYSLYIDLYAADDWFKKWCKDPPK